MRIKNARDFWAGMMFVSFGVLFAVLGQRYQLGTPDRMGPGWFPTALGILLILLGLPITLGAMVPSAEETKLAPVGWREIGLTLAAVALFAFLLPYLGMIVSTAIMLIVAAFASSKSRWKEVLVSIVLLLLLSYVVFIRALQVPFPVWPTVFRGWM